MNQRYDAVCGLYCGACRVVQSNERGCLEELAREWNREPDDLVCHGCKSSVRAVFCRDCRFIVCAESRGVEYCSECSDFPCEELLAFRDDDAPHHSAVVRNSEMMRELGVERWLETQSKRWSCPECGARSWWYLDVCGSCGSALRDARAEEAETDTSFEGTPS